MSTKSADKKNSYRISAYNSLNNILINNGFTDLSIQKEISKNKNLSPKDISLLNETVYGIVRNKTKIDYICSKFIKKPVSKEQIQNLIRIGTYELLFLEGVKEHASIYETVELAKRIFGQGISKFINGVLRNIQRHDKN